MNVALTNHPKVFAEPIQLPKIDHSDHYAVLIKPSNPAVASRANRSIVYKRDLRESCVCIWEMDHRIQLGLCV